MNNRPRLSVKQYLKLMSRLDILIHSVERLDGSDYITTNRGDFFSYLTDLAIILWREISESCSTQSEQVTNGPFERGWRWFRLFFLLIFSYFIF